MRMPILFLLPLAGLAGPLRPVWDSGMLKEAPVAPEGARAIVGSLVPFATGIIVSVIVMAFYFFLRRRITRLGIAASVPLREFLEEANQRRR